LLSAQAATDDLDAQQMMQALKSALDQRDDARNERDEALRNIESFKQRLADSGGDGAPAESEESARDSNAMRFAEASMRQMQHEFDQTSQKMMAQTLHLDIQLEAANNQISVLQTREKSFQSRLLEVEQQASQQDAIVGSLLDDLEVQRRRVTASNPGRESEEQLEGIAIMRANEKQRLTLANAAGKLRDLDRADADDVVLEPGKSSDLRPRSGRFPSLSEAEAHTLDNLLVLPEGWTSAVSPEGITFYIDHRTEITTWVHPAVRDGDGSIRASPTSPVVRNEIGILLGSPSVKVSKRRFFGRRANGKK
jgi:hypothetical protein